MFLGFIGFWIFDILIVNRLSWSDMWSVGPILLACLLDIINLNVFDCFVDI